MTALREPAATSARPARRSAVEVEPVTFPRTLSSEFLKFVTLRSTVAVLGAAVLGMIVIALLVAYNTRHISSNLQPDDLVPSAILQGYYLSQLLVGALGILLSRANTAPE